MILVLATVNFIFLLTSRVCFCLFVLFCFVLGGCDFVSSLRNSEFRLFLDFQVFLLICFVFGRVDFDSCLSNSEFRLFLDFTCEFFLFLFCFWGGWDFVSSLSNSEFHLFIDFTCVFLLVCFVLFWEGAILFLLLATVNFVFFLTSGVFACLFCFILGGWNLDFSLSNR